MKAGDRLMWRQWEASGTTAGLVMGFTDGTQNWSPGVNLVDQHGEGLHPSAISPQWIYRIGNLSPAAGKTISYFAVGAGGYGAGLWGWYYQDMVFVGADGTVIPLYNHNQTISLYGFGSSGMTQGGYEINHDPNATSYSGWASTMYYHGDQIGSSRLMTSDGGWPGWQGTFLPYGEEYNPQITTNHYKFTGKERDSESGLDYFGARYYGSGLGRFITTDPIQIKTNRLLDPQRLNLYVYGRSNPLAYIDADGKDAIALAYQDSHYAGAGALFGNKLWSFGHAGVVTVNSKGHAIYYDKNGSGVHREDLGNFKVDKNGKLSNKDTASIVQKLSKEHGESGTTKFGYFKANDDQVNKMNQDADKRADASPAEKYSGTSSNCANFVEDELKDGNLATSDAVRPNGMFDDIKDKAEFTGTLKDGSDKSKDDLVKELDAKDKDKKPPN